MDLSRNGYTHDEVAKVLHSSNRHVDFRYELLDKFNRRIKDLENVIDGSGVVEQQALAQIKRTAKFSLIEGDDIDYLNHRIKPYMVLRMPEVVRASEKYEDVVGRNLLEGSKDFLDWQITGNRYVIVSPQRTLISDYVLEFNTNSNGYGVISDFIEVGLGDEFVFSSKIEKVSGSIESNSFIRGAFAFDANEVLLEGGHLTALSHNTGNTFASYVGSYESLLNYGDNVENEGYIHFKVTSPDVKYIRVRAGTYRGGSAGNSRVRVSKLKLEKGSTATPWSPAPEDLPSFEDYEKEWMRKEITPKKIPSQDIEFPLGVFLMSSPTRKDEGLKRHERVEVLTEIDGVTNVRYENKISPSVTREIECFDLTLILLDDKFQDRYTIEENTPFYEAIVDILTSSGISHYNIERTEKKLTRTKEFDPGTSKLEAINELLDMLNYTPIFVDENGYFVSRLYISPVDRGADYSYIDNRQSITLLGAEEELDTFNVPNVFRVVRTNEEEEPLVSSFVNDNPNNPLSTVNRARQIVDYREIDDIADQEALDAHVERIAFEANQVYGRIRFSSALMPFHSYADVLNLRYQNLGIDGKYLELSWTMELKTAGVMTHELRQIVPF